VRVIAGSAKGRKLGAVPPGVRPVSDRAREGLFSSLAAEIPDARVLDLYAGTGAMGIEALSRGAEAAVFVDRSTEACAVIYGNLALTGLQDRATVVAADAGAFLSGHDRSAGPFDLALLDPPYELEGPDLAVVLRELSSGWLAEDGWTVALTRGVKSSTPVIPVHWAVARQLRYGDSLVILYREVSWA
jgi:16S rRNA (guanine966-N2)-methyltransferase